jgi:hypothetical protein
MGCHAMGFLTITTCSVNHSQWHNGSTKQQSSGSPPARCLAWGSVRLARDPNRTLRDSCTGTLACQITNVVLSLLAVPVPVDEFA